MISLLRLSTAKRFMRVAQAFGKSVTVTALNEALTTVKEQEQSPPHPSFAMKNIEHRLHRGVRQFRRSAEFLLDRLDVGRTAVPQYIHDLQLQRRELLLGSSFTTHC